LIALCGNLLVSAALWTLAFLTLWAGHAVIFSLKRPIAKLRSIFWTCELAYTPCCITATEKLVQGLSL
jgi:hypothetical protein